MGWLLGVKKLTFLFYGIQKQAVGSKESIPPAYVACVGNFSPAYGG
jgi:hypothetical protein